MDKVTIVLCAVFIIAGCIIGWMLRKKERQKEEGKREKKERRRNAMIDMKEVEKAMEEAAARAKEATYNDHEKIMRALELLLKRNWEGLAALARMVCQEAEHRAIGASERARWDTILSKSNLDLEMK